MEDGVRKLLSIFIIFFIMIITIEKAESSNLLVTNLDLNNHTIQRNETQSLSPDTTTTPMKIADSSSRSEIYKMHSNGLVLLHAQRAKHNIGAKKSNLLQTSDSSSINYHVRSRTKDNNTASNEVAETERHLEAKLGNLPQINEREKLIKTNHKRSLVLPSPVPFIPQIKKLCKDKKSDLRCHLHNKMTNKKVHTHHRHHIARKWMSIIQGESDTGKDIQKSNILPVQLDETFHKKDSKLDHLPPDLENIHTIDKIAHERLRRAFFVMNDDREKETRINDNPIFDVEQPEEIRRDYREKIRKRRRKRLRQKLAKLYSRGISGGITDIPKIPPIGNSFEPIEPLKMFPQFPDFKPGLENYPRFGVSDLKLENYPRFGEPKMDLYEQIPGIPHIRPLSRGDEVTGDRRGLPFDKNEFYDEDLDDSVDHEPSPTPPTPIPSLTDIPDITDIPTIKPIPAAPGQPVGTGRGINGKTPIMQTIDTKNGKATQISA